MHSSPLKLLAAVVPIYKMGLSSDASALGLMNAWWHPGIGSLFWVPNILSFVYRPQWWFSSKICGQSLPSTFLHPVTLTEIHKWPPPHHPDLFHLPQQPFSKNPWPVPCHVKFLPTPTLAFWRIHAQPTFFNWWPFPGIYE